MIARTMQYVRPRFAHMTPIKDGPSPFVRQSLAITLLSSDAPDAPVATRPRWKGVCREYQPEKLVEARRRGRCGARGERPRRCAGARARGGEHQAQGREGGHDRLQ